MHSLIFVSILRLLYWCEHGEREKERKRERERERERERSVGRVNDVWVKGWILKKVKIL